MRRRRFTTVMQGGDGELLRWTVAFTRAGAWRVDEQSVRRMAMAMRFRVGVRRGAREATTARYDGDSGRPRRAGGKPTVLDSRINGGALLSSRVAVGVESILGQRRNGTRRTKARELI